MDLSVLLHLISRWWCQQTPDNTMIRIPVINEDDDDDDDRRLKTSEQKRGKQK